MNNLIKNYNSITKEKRKAIGEEMKTFLTINNNDNNN